MLIKKCRVCGNSFFQEPLLRYRNMPCGAQFFPGQEGLKKDKGVDLEVCQCSSCGLVQLSNGPVAYYKEVIRATAISEEMQGFRNKQFADFVRRFSLRRKKIIEIGCGRGEYLSIMQQFSTGAYGLEYSQASVAQCIKRRLKVSQGFIQNSAVRLKHTPFDAFFIFSFLEHLPDPNATLRGIYNNLTDDAVGLIEVPNFDMILRNKLFSEFIGDHLLYFTKETLNATLRRNGFKVIDSNEVWHKYIISAVVKPVRNKKIETQQLKNLNLTFCPAKSPKGEKKSKKLNLAHFYKYQMKLKSEIEEYIRRFKNKKIAIWGAGHQALAVISLINLAGKIRYVVDSATFKQAKFTPATHIPIVAPDALADDPVDAVIVMASSYSDEVARLIRRKFDRGMNISILRNFRLEII